MAYVQKLGGEVARQVLTVKQFWPPGSSTGEWRNAKTWEEAAMVAKEYVEAQKNVKVVAESGVAAGVRRIEAVGNGGAIDVEPSHGAPGTRFVAPAYRYADGKPHRYELEELIYAELRTA